MITVDTITKAQESFDQLMAKVCTLEECEALKNDQLGKQGLVAAWYKDLAQLDIEGKKTLWPSITWYKQHVEESIDKIFARLKKEKNDAMLMNDLVDYSLTRPLIHGHSNLIQQELARLIPIFQRYGFAIADGDEIVTKQQNFYSVNIPPSHPATQIHDTIYVKHTDTDGENMLLRTHTSCLQQQLIQQYGPECQFVVPGRVYRFENLDATHDVAFWQIEGVSIRKGMNLPQFKHTLKVLLSEIFEKNLDIRLRPWYFPFTEPSYEVDIDCRNDPALFALSKNRGRLEILWCGMIHPNVLRNAWVDADVFSGFAFGFWLSRMVAIKHGISDIRLLTNGDMRFAQSR